jgi:hypothetical protein
MSFTLSCRIIVRCECGYDNGRDVFLFGPNKNGAVMCSKCNIRVGSVHTFGPGDIPRTDATNPIKSSIWLMHLYKIRHW